jgi:hypothetical protein
MIKLSREAADCRHYWRLGDRGLYFVIHRRICATVGIMIAAPLAQDHQMASVR